MSAFVRKYATATNLYLPMIKRGQVDFAVGADWTPATGDVKVSIDGGAAANIGTLPTAIAMGNTAMWDFTISSGETTGKKIAVTVADSATKAVEDQMFIIETYGHASAEVDSIWNEPMTELAAVPSVTASLRDAIRWLFLLARNKRTTTATTETLRNDADNASIGTASVSDDATTFTRNEWS